MAQCPSCQGELPDDFGLIDCSHCAAGLFIEFDGSVRLRESEGSLAVPPPLEVQNQSAEPVPQDYETPVIESPVFVMETEEIKEEEVAAEGLPPMAVAQAPSSDQVLEDLVAFGNSQESTGREGAYFYDLMISGIDSADLREEVKEALTDPLFLWDVEAMIRTMQLGELVLRQVTSVKAALVVQRLTSLPVQVKWVQHAITEA